MHPSIDELENRPNWNILPPYEDPTEQVANVRDIIITGASRGIWRALALELATRPPFPARLILSARDEARLRDVATAVRSSGTMALGVQGDLRSLASVRNLGERLGEEVRAPAILVHNAGLWPDRRELTPDRLETAFAVNFIGPLLLQRMLLERRCLDRIMVISAGLLVKGRFSSERTPTGLDFSTWRTYCTTKLAFAMAERDEAVQRPDVDFAVLHPGVVRTDLGARRGLLGWLLKKAKRSWESPEVCGERLRRFFEMDRWSPAGEARWFFESDAQPWPAITDDVETRRAVLEAACDFLPAAA